MCEMRCNLSRCICSTEDRGSAIPVVTSLYSIDDDKPETVQKRLNVYHEQTQPLIDYYTTQGVLKTVDGTRDLNEVFQEIVDILGE